MILAVSAALSLVSAVVVAVLSHIFAAKRSRRDTVTEMQINAFADFIRATAQLAAARRIGITDTEFSELANLNDAKARLIICSEPSVVLALSEFWAAGGTLEREREILAYQRLCFSMRESLGYKRFDIALSNLSDILFKLQPSAYSYKSEKDES